MKRPPGLWILLSAGVLWLSLQDVKGIRATARFFNKTTTTTTDSTLPEENSTEIVTDVPTVSNTTKPPLTGNPQIDYVFDPNLPQELNGYNLSEYPFYGRVPEPDEIKFKCDGLHDGFYASIPHKCQVYHHCLYGTRYDFLCANFTAFDQKTFICQFVSVVDCVNSKKWWHRNDALYEATTTVKPVVLYTPPPPPPVTPRRPGGPRRRPLRRRRPQYEYYEDEEEYEDDYYEERPRAESRRRKRPRPSRPIYEDDYEEIEERFQRKGTNRQNQDRRRGENDRKKDDKDEGRYQKRRPLEEEPLSEEERVPEKRRTRPRRPSTQDEDYEDPPKRAKEERRSRPRKPIEDDYQEEPEKTNDEEKLTVGKQTGSIFDRPRTAPKIKRPVPKHEANKYAFKPASNTEKNDDDYEEYEEVEEAPKRRKPLPERPSSPPRKAQASASRQRPTQAPKEQSYEEITSRRPFSNGRRNRDRERTRGIKKKPEPPPPLEEYDDYEEEPSSVKPKKTTTTTPIPSTTTPKDLPRPESIVRIVKRPFLPSRGGNPYSSRGLQPVGAKALEDSSIEDEEEETLEITPPVKKRQKYAPPEEAIAPVTTRSRGSFKNRKPEGPQTTPKPKIDPLDIDENEYDVTLNDALNPTLPNLPVRGFPTGFSANQDYTYGQRPRYVVDNGAEYNNKAPVVRQRYEQPVSSFSGSQDQFVNANQDYKGQYSTIQQQSFRPRVTQAYYSTF